jgi:hypothetical protein
MGDARASPRGPVRIGICLLVVAGLVVAPAYAIGHSAFERSGKKNARVLFVRPKTPLFSINNARPGTRVTRAVSVRYAGKRPAKLRFRLVTRAPKIFSSRLRLVVVAKRRVVYSGRLRAFRPRVVGTISRRKPLRFRISLVLPKGASSVIDDPFQGRKSKIRFLWTTTPLRR